MTRINGSIDPSDLTDQHLLAEYREMIRIPNHVLKRDVLLHKIPESFRLGRGHVTFFYDKIQFLHERFVHIKNVMDSRLIKNSMDDTGFKKVQHEKPHLYNNIADLSDGNMEVAKRIAERVIEMKKRPTINGEEVSDRYEYATALISKYTK